MNDHNVVQLHPTVDKKSELYRDVRRVVNAAHDAGFKMGERVGFNIAMASMRRRLDRRLGVGFVCGVVFGAAVTFATVGWLP